MLYFNSIKVQLERLVSRGCTHHLDFNSIKVQLEHDVDYVIDTYMLFQFHKGTIRTY